MLKEDLSGNNSKPKKPKRAKIDANSDINSILSKYTLFISKYQQIVSNLLTSKLTLVRKFSSADRPNKPSRRWNLDASPDI